MPAGSDFRVEFDPSQIAGFLRAVKGFDPALATATRRRLRQVGVETIEDMRRVIASGPGSGAQGIKAGISQGLKTAVRTGKRTQGVQMTATASNLRDAHKAMLRLYNKATFRHPVFGNRNVWVNQKARPYFGSVIKKHEDDMAEAVWQALEDAFDAMGAAK